MKSVSRREAKALRRAGLPREEAPLHWRHFRFGWWTILIFLSFGIVLEGFHGFKSGLYLDVSNQTRRLFWTLAHAHGALLGLIHILFGATCSLLKNGDMRNLGLASVCLMSATIFIPGGFFLGGAILYGGDPGIGIVLVPIGGLFLCMSVWIMARSTRGLTDVAESQIK